MKKFLMLAAALLMLSCSCQNGTESKVCTKLPRPAATPSQRGTTAHEALEGIDSLMWWRADSALAVMMEFAASPEADSMDVFEGHYCQVLVAELLYKNDYGQSNRAEVLKVVHFF